MRPRLARGKGVTTTDIRARNTMLEVAKTLDALADIEERMAPRAADEEEP